MPRPKGSTLTQEHKDNIRKTMNARWDLIREIMAEQSEQQEEEDDE